GLGAMASTSKLECFPGDVSAPSLGLERSAWETLGRRAERIYHSAAHVNFMYSYGALRAANVSAVTEILRLACSAGSCPVHHISTVGVTDAAAGGLAAIDERTALEA